MSSPAKGPHSTCLEPHCSKMGKFTRIEFLGCIPSLSHEAAGAQKGSRTCPRLLSNLALQLGPEPGLLTSSWVSPSPLQVFPHLNTHQNHLEQVCLQRFWLNEYILIRVFHLQVMETSTHGTDFPGDPEAVSMLPMQRAQVQSLVKELDPTCRN